MQGGVRASDLGRRPHSRRKFLRRDAPRGRPRQRRPRAPEGGHKGRPYDEDFALLNPGYRRVVMLAFAPARFSAAVFASAKGKLVEPGGIEPPTSCMPCRRSPS